MIMWKTVLNNKTNRKAVVEFAEGHVGLKSFRKSLNDDARHAIGKIDSVNDIRRLSRRALRRANINYTVGSEV
jgi:hypothetical protein